MTEQNAARFPLGVSFHTLDLEQRSNTASLLAGSSVSAVELWEPTFDKEEKSVREMGRIFEDAGVEVRTIHANFGNTLDISSPDSSVRSPGIQAIQTALDLGVRMGARIVVVHPSSEPISDEERPARIEETKRSLETIAAIAGDAGCRIAVEVLPRSCIGNSAAEMSDLLEDIDPGTAGVCLDTNHFMGDFASLPSAVHSLGSRIIALHCSDYDGIDERHWPPLKGVIDWSALLSSLSEVGFTGPLHYEANLDGQTPAERLAFLEANYQELLDRSDTASGR